VKGTVLQRKKGFKRLTAVREVNRKTTPEEAKIDISTGKTF